MVILKLKSAFEDIVYKNILTRRSVREYSNKKVTKSQIMKILKAGHFAPSPKNSLPWLFVVIVDKKMIEKIMTINTPDRPEGNSLLKKKKEDNFNINFPKAIIAIFFEKKRSIFYDERYYGNIDKTDYDGIGEYSYSDIVGVGCAVENMALMTHAMGLSGCITGDLLEKGINPEIYDWLNVDRNKYQLITGFRIGYPKERKNRFFRTPLINHVLFKR